MIIYPAIDIRNGKCVRLYQGDYNRETIYNADPFFMANKFASEGANWIHIVDLDGAKNPSQNQSTLIGELIKINNINVQTGGGIRSKSQIQNLLNQGAARIIIGSMAVTNRNEVAEWFKYFGSEKLALALDISVNAKNQPIVAINGWQNTSEFTLYELIEYYQTLGLTHLLCTNISLDGTLNGPDYKLYDSILKKFPFLKLQASGGVQSLTDIKTLRKNRLSGAIVGRALYENKFTLNEALSC